MNPGTGGPPSSRPVLVKLGGSILTDKAQRNTLRADALKRLARELAEVPGPLVLVHGAGSFGHVVAGKHRVHEGRTGPATPRHAARVRADVTRLHLHVLEALEDAGLAPAGVPGFALARLRDGELDAPRLDPVTDALRGGFAPVTHGDVVHDTHRGFGIVSGDALMEHLAAALRPRLAVFATDVDGILDADGSPRPVLDADDAEHLPDAGASRHPDVTGGMAGKLQHMTRIARQGTPVRVVNGSHPGRVAGAATGTPLTGTLICQGGSLP